MIKIWRVVVRREFTFDVEAESEAEAKLKAMRMETGDDNLDVERVVECWEWKEGDLDV